MHLRRGGLRRLAILFAVATVGVLAVGAQAASANVIEICKSSANGMSGRAFQYSITGGASVTVNGGRCSGPITVAGAQVTVTEAQSNPATDVHATTVRPSLRKVSEDLVNRSVTVTTGASTSSETLVTFTNQPAGGNYGTLKVCKLTETPAYLGKLFSLLGQRWPARLDRGERRLRRSGELVVPHPGLVPGRLERQRARADPGGHGGAVHRLRSGHRTRGLQHVHG